MKSFRGITLTRVLIVVATIGGLSIIGGLGYVAYQNWFGETKLAAEYYTSEEDCMKAGYYWYNQACHSVQRKKQKVNDNQTKPDQTSGKPDEEKKQRSEEEDDLENTSTKGWKVYQNKQFGFKMRFAPLWKIPEEQPNQRLGALNFPSKKDSANLGISFYSSGIEAAVRDTTEQWKDYHYEHRGEYSSSTIMTEDFAKSRIEFSDLSGYKISFLKHTREENKWMEDKNKIVKNILYIIKTNSGGALRIWYSSDGFRLSEFEKEPNRDQQRLKNLERMIKTLTFL